MILMFQNISNYLLLSLSVNLRMSKVFFVLKIMPALEYGKTVRYQCVKTVSYRCVTIVWMRFSAIDKSRLLS